jgi:hypothetical protein
MGLQMSWKIREKIIDSKGIELTEVLIAFVTQLHHKLV